MFIPKTPRFTEPIRKAFSDQNCVVFLQQINRPRFILHRKIKRDNLNTTEYSTDA